MRDRSRRLSGSTTDCDSCDPLGDPDAVCAGGADAAVANADGVSAAAPADPGALSARCSACGSPPPPPSPLLVVLPAGLPLPPPPAGRCWRPPATWPCCCCCCCCCGVGCGVRLGVARPSCRPSTMAGSSDGTSLTPDALSICRPRLRLRGALMARPAETTTARKKCGRGARSALLQAPCDRAALGCRLCCTNAPSALLGGCGSRARAAAAVGAPRAARGASPVCQLPPLCPLLSDAAWRARLGEPRARGCEGDGCGSGMRE
eukprot:356789-Chlamydomonas_euryale.AAC.3